MKLYKCCVLNCFNTRSSDKKVALFRFPKSIKIQKKWREILNYSERITSHTLVCSEHFNKKYLVKRAKCFRLTKDAVPTILASSSKNLTVEVEEIFQETQLNTSTSSEDINYQPILKKNRLEMNTSNIEFSEELISTGFPDTELDEDETMSVPMQFSSPSSFGRKSPPIIYVGPSEIFNLNPNKTFEKSRKITSKGILRTDTPETELSSNSETELLSPSNTARSKTKLTYRNLQRYKKTLLQKLRRRNKKIDDLEKTVLQNLRHRNEKIDGLEELLHELKHQNLIHDEEFDRLSCTPNAVKMWFKRQLQNDKGNKLPETYPIGIRSFAMNLNFSAPRAYDYVRNVLNFLLPDPETLGKWYKNVDGNAGFTKESFDTLKVLAKFAAKKNEFIYCNMVFGEINIISQLEWNGKRYVGCVDFGDEYENETVARQILVFMAVGVNKNWKLPLGYFPIDSVNSDQKHNLVKMCLQNLFESDVKVIGVSFDGCPTNFAVGNLLGGCTFINTSGEDDNLNPVFQLNHQSKKENLVILPRPSHMLKLIRNTLAEKGPLLDNTNQEISWNYLEQLIILQNNEKLHLRNKKLRLAHVYFKSKKMNVRLETQAFSKSVADALEFCNKHLKLPQFMGCEATIKFIRQLNDIFDLLNSRNMSQKGLKQSLCNANEKIVLDLVPTFIKYLASIKIRTGSAGNENFSSVLTSMRKTGFVGMILCLKSVDFLYKNYINTKLLKFIPFYKVNQDHLELFYASIRSRLPSNSNPTVRQFTAAYKRLIVLTQISDSGLRNCLPIEETHILNPVSVINFTTDRANLIEIVSNAEEINIVESIETSDFLPDLTDIFQNIQKSEFVENVIEYVAGFIVFHLKKCLKCSDCLSSLEKTNCSTSLVLFKNRGGLTFPSDNVLILCRLTENEIRQLQNENEHVILNTKTATKIAITVQTAIINTNIFSDLNNHEHFILLIKLIINKYLNVRFHYIAKNTKKKNSFRNKLNRLILFNGI